MKIHVILTSCYKEKTQADELPLLITISTNLLPLSRFCVSVRSRNIFLFDLLPLPQLYASARFPQKFMLKVSLSDVEGVI